jgi:uncharacterized membrane protein
VGVSVVSFGILTPVLLAGYTNAILDMVRIGREPAPRDLFSHLRLFFPLLLFTLVLVVVVTIGFFLLVLPGLVIIFAATFYLIYMVPLMVDKNRGLMDAFKESISLVRHTRFFDHLVLVVLYLMVQSLGGSTLLGTVITIPISTIFLMIAYDQVAAS